MKFMQQMSKTMKVHSWGGTPHTVAAFGEGLGGGYPPLPLFPYIVLSISGRLVPPDCRAVSCVPCHEIAAVLVLLPWLCRRDSVAAMTLLL